MHSESRNLVGLRQRQSPGKGLGQVSWSSAYRAVYTVKFETAVYVLHAFQKKSPSGIRTAQRDVDLIGDRLKTAEKDYKEHYGKPKR